MFTRNELLLIREILSNYDKHQYYSDNEVAQMNEIIDKITDSITIVEEN